MSEIRQDPTTEEWVIMARERAKRPTDFVRGQAEAESPVFLPSCPFCLGNEAMTPPEVLGYRDGGSQGWRVRAFANRFPALTPEGGAVRRREEGFFAAMDGVGFHEVIVETPSHNRPPALMRDDEVAAVLMAYKERYNALSRLAFVKLVIIFKNHGPSAGTSLEHPHSQLVATPIVPGYVRRRHQVASRYHNRTSRCLYSDLADHELRMGKRVVMQTEKFVAFHPFASHWPFETWIVPRVQQACFGNASAEELEDLAKVLRASLFKLRRGLNNPDFNYVIDTAPVGEETSGYYLWHVRIVPRLMEVAGFEIGSGIHINTALPEDTAQFMRELKID
ncbi:MAG: galactose-1-phosphate uridylyltransferase [Chloroflexi bacterium]|nr:galactose-1-phosphate uridylyltransferase [Chloroflexota bacterium]